MEEHCEMQPGSVEAILIAHRGPWAAVGSDFINGNPDAESSNKAFRMNYGAYVGPARPRGPVPRVAGQNSAFKRDVLLRYEPYLEWMMNADLVLQLKMATGRVSVLLRTGYEVRSPERKHFSQSGYRSFLLELVLLQRPRPSFSVGAFPPGSMDCPFSADSMGPLLPGFFLDAGPRRCALPTASARHSVCHGDQLLLSRRSGRRVVRKS